MPGSPTAQPKIFAGFRFDPALHDRLKRLAEHEQRSVNWMVTRLLLEALPRYEARLHEPPPHEA